MGLCWQSGKGFSLLRACCPSCQDLGCNGGDEDAPTPSSCPPTPLTAQKPGPATMDVPWCLAQGLLMSSFSMHVALWQGHPCRASPRQGTREPGTAQRHSDALGSVWRPESFVPIKQRPVGPAGLRVLVAFVSKPRASPGRALPAVEVGQGEVTCPAGLLSFSVCSVGNLHEKFGCWGSWTVETEDDRAHGSSCLALCSMACARFGFPA